MSERLAGPRAIVFGCLFGVLFWAALLFAVCTISEAEPRDDSQTMAQAGIAQWQQVSGAQFHGLTVHIAPLLPPVYYADQTAQAWVSATSCEVRLDPVFWPALPEQAKQNVITHELGHCLGLSHTETPGVMSNPLFFNFTAADGAFARALWPLPYRVRGILCNGCNTGIGMFSENIDALANAIAYLLEANKWR